MKLHDVQQDRAFDYLFLYKRMFPYVKPYLFRGILAMLIAVPVGLMEGVKGYALKPFLDYLGNAIKTNDMSLASDVLIFIPLAIIFFSILQGGLGYLNNYLNNWTGQKITMGLKKALFQKLLKFETAFYDKNSSGVVMMRFMSDADMACAGILNNFKELISTATSSIALIGILMFLSWKLSIFAVIVLGGALIPVSLIKKHIKYNSQENLKIGSSVTTHFYETFNGNRIIASFNLQNYQFETFFEQLTKSFNISMKLTKRVAWLGPIMNLIASCGLAGVLWFGGHLLLTGAMSIGSMAAFVTSLLLLYRPVKNLGNILASMQGSFIGMNRVVDLFDLQPSIKSKPDAVKIETVKDSIKFENVMFEYEETEPVLKGINFDIKIGESLALVGNSGGGKTTAANLIPRFYDVKEGSIKIDGIDVKDIELESLRQNIAIVFQDNFLFTGSIKDNILLGKFDATDEEINNSIKSAYLDEFIASLPTGIDTEIGERGVRLSGGQKQRLAIARAMVKNAPVVILDEATSALDNKAEAVVQKAMEKLMENRTVIVIAHRLSTVQNATNIAVIEQGELMELGSHDRLMQNEDGAYKSLYMAQFKKNTGKKHNNRQETEESLQEV